MMNDQLVSVPSRTRKRRNAIAFIGEALDYVARRPMLYLLLPAALHVVLALIFVGRLGIPIPKVPDEFSYLLGSDTFASGRLANPTHPMWVYFETVFVIHVPTYVSMYHPAQALFLAFGQRFLGHPWYGVVISAALMCSAIAWMLRAWFPPRWAVLGSLLAVQMAIVNLARDQTGYYSSSYWGGAVAGIGGALVLGALGRLRREVRVRDAVLFGIGVVIMATSRPYEGLLLLVVVGVVLLLLMRKGRVSMGAWLKRFILPAGLLIGLGAGMLSYYCYRTTGNPVKLPYNVVLEQYMIRRMFYWGHNQVRTFRHPALERHYRALLRPEVSMRNKAVHFTTRFSIFYFGPVLIGVLLMLPWVLRDRKFRPLLASLIIVVIGVSFLEWIHIHYIAPITAVFIGLTLQCLRHVRTLRFGRVRFGRAAVVVLVAVNLIVTVNHARYFWSNRLHGWWVTRQNIIDNLTATGQKHLMIVRYADNHPPVWEWIWNAADIDKSSVVWAREMPDNRPLLNYFRDRKVWLLEPDKYPITPQPYVP